MAKNIGIGDFGGMFAFVFRSPFVFSHCAIDAKRSNQIWPNCLVSLFFARSFTVFLILLWIFVGNRNTWSVDVIVCELNLIPSERTTTTRRKKIRNGKYSIKQSQKIGSQTGKVFIDFVAVAAAAVFLCRLWSDYIVVMAVGRSCTSELDDSTHFPPPRRIAVSSIQLYVDLTLWSTNNLQIVFFHIWPNQDMYARRFFRLSFTVFFSSLVPILLQHPLN